MGILTGLDDIQQQLDDHILKSQTMRGSPYVKAFEADMAAWEEKLISMQDILDQWLQVIKHRSYYLYYHLILFPLLMLSSSIQELLLNFLLTD